jgi:hypothetical protein
MIDDQSADVTGLMIAARVINLWIPRFFDVSKSRLQIFRTVAVTIGILQSKFGNLQTPPLFINRPPL